MKPGNANPENLKTLNIYCDYNATTPVAPEVLRVMLPYFTEKFGNASSQHFHGWTAAAAVDIARERVAEFINVSKTEIIFTSGATEAINLAIKGVAESYVPKSKHIVIAATEHKAVLDVCKSLENKGFLISTIGVDPYGELLIDQLSDAVTEKTMLVCVMLANNETGVINDIKTVASITNQKNVLLFCDATQAAGKIKIDNENLGADLLCLSAHKFYGPKGVGALYVKRKKPKVVLQPQLIGGGHEAGLRSGTLNIPGITGMGMACQIASEKLPHDTANYLSIRKKFEEALLATNRVKINGHRSNRLPNTSNLCFESINSKELLQALRSISASTGSACSAATEAPSHVLKAMGLSNNEILSSVRFSFGRYSTANETDYCINALTSYIKMHPNQ